jgi:hypothetical protein
MEKSYSTPITRVHVSRALLPTSKRPKQTMKILLIAEILSKLDITCKLIVCLYYVTVYGFLGILIF